MEWAIYIFGKWHENLSLVLRSLPFDLKISINDKNHLKDFNIFFLSSS